MYYLPNANPPKPARHAKHSSEKSEPGTVESGAVKLGADKLGADKSGADKSGAVEPTVGQMQDVNELEPRLQDNPKAATCRTERRYQGQSDDTKVRETQTLLDSSLCLERTLQGDGEQGSPACCDGAVEG